MSLVLDVDRVSAVLLADGWHNVAFDPEGASTFYLDAYEFIRGNEVVHAGGASGVCSTGATWLDKDGGFYIACPLTAILAIRTIGTATSRSGQA
jgi:hypothetical protein